LPELELKDGFGGIAWFGIEVKESLWQEESLFVGVSLTQLLA
jgi:hypothetical protein